VCLYQSRFVGLNKELKGVFNEEVTAKFFINGLDPKLRMGVLRSNASTLSQAIETAKVEEEIRGRCNDERSINHTLASSEIDNMKAEIAKLNALVGRNAKISENSANDMVEIRAAIASINDQLKAVACDIPRPDNRRRRNKNIICYKCGKIGHMKRQCQESSSTLN
jgi:hypothetical protein